MKLIDILNEVRPQQLDLLQFVKNNKEEIAQLNPQFTKIIMNNGESRWTLEEFTEGEYFSSYENEGYTEDKFIKDWNTYNPEVVLLGEELATVFITNQPLPLQFANTLTSNDEVFFGTRQNPVNAFKKYVVNGRSLYIVWGIPDPGS